MHGGAAAAVGTTVAAAGGGALVVVGVVIAALVVPAFVRYRVAEDDKVVTRRQMSGIASFSAQFIAWRR